MINVLDHGFVRLVSYTQPAATDPQNVDFHGLPPEWTGDLEVVRNARVSYDADWRTGEDEDKDEKLLDYMIRNKHTSPFEAMVFTFEVKAPIFVFRQWHRHRTWSYNELSARYAPMQEEFYIPDSDKIGVQSKDNKQVRELSDKKTPEPFTTQSIMYNVADIAFRSYQQMLSAGVPRELARTVLPLSIYSRMFATVDLHNLIHFFRLRIHPHAQWEIQQYALALLELITPVVPVIAAKLKSGLVGSNPTPL